MGALKVLYKEILGKEIPSCKNGCLGVIQPGNQSIRTVLGIGFFFSACKGSTGYRVFWYRWKEKILEKMRKRPQGGEKKKENLYQEEGSGHDEKAGKIHSDGSVDKSA